MINLSKTERIDMLEESKKTTFHIYKEAHI